MLKIPYKIKIKKKNIKKIDLIDLFKEEDWGMVQGLKKEVSDFKKILKQYTHKNTHNYYSRDSTPIKIASKIIKKYKLDKTKLTISAKRDKIKLNPIIKVNKKFLNMLGLYVAEGFSRCKRTGKGYYQVYIA